MKLHRVGRKADWQTVSPSQRNLWQRFAARTNGVVTPANCLTLVGLSLVLYGLGLLFTKHTLNGIVLILAGRVLDVFDGWVADSSGTKSPVGEMLDATVDKVAIFLFCVTAIMVGSIPLSFIVPIVTLSLLIGAIGAYARLSKIEIHANAKGKIATAGLWLSMLLYSCAASFSTQRQLVTTLALVVFGIAFVLSIGALWEYAKELIIGQHARTDQSRRSIDVKRLLIIRNPASTNSQLAERYVDELINFYPSVPHRIITTQPDSRRALGQFFQHYADKLGPSTLLCVIGGDGTVNTVIELLLTLGNLSASARLTPILPIWGGNGNDLAVMLNGVGSPEKIKSILERGRLTAIYPLECIMRIKKRGRLVRIAASYIAFGATAEAAHKLNEPSYRKNWQRAIPIVRLFREASIVLRLWLSTKPFSVTEHGKVTPVYDRIFTNGPRIGKLEVFPAKLTESSFYKLDYRTNYPTHLIERILDVIDRQRFKLRRRLLDRFTLRQDTWAQFDGEDMLIPARTKITIKHAYDPFYTISTRET